MQFSCELSCLLLVVIKKLIMVFTIFVIATVFIAKERTNPHIRNFECTWQMIMFPSYLLFFFRSSHQRCSMKKGVLKNFTIFTGKHMRQSHFFNKVAGGTCNFIKKDTLTQVFSCEFCKISKSTFFTEHLRTTASTFIFNMVASYD